MSSNYQFDIDGLESSIRVVRRVEPITFKVLNARGSASSNNASEAKLMVSDLALTVPATGTKDLDHWFEEFVVEGKTRDERRGTIKFLGQSRDVLARVDLHNLGIYRLKDHGEGGTVTAHLYCERIGFSYRRRG